MAVGYGGAGRRQVPALANRKYGRISINISNVMAI